MLRASPRRNLPFSLLSQNNINKRNKTKQKPNIFTILIYVYLLYGFLCCAKVAARAIHSRSHNTTAYLFVSWFCFHPFVHMSSRFALFFSSLSVISRIQSVRFDIFSKLYSSNGCMETRRGIEEAVCMQSQVIWLEHKCFFKHSACTCMPGSKHERKHFRVLRRLV